MASLVVIREGDQTRRELCEDCEHSRGEGVMLRCALKRNTPCQHAATLRDRGSRCPRHDEYAIIWQAAALDSPGRCGDARAKSMKPEHVGDASSLLLPTPSILPRGVQTAAEIRQIDGIRPL